MAKKTKTTTNKAIEKPFRFRFGLTWLALSSVYFVLLFTGDDKPYIMRRAQAQIWNKDIPIPVWHELPQQIVFSIFGPFLGAAGDFDPSYGPAIGIGLIAISVIVTGLAGALAAKAFYDWFL